LKYAQTGPAAGGRAERPRQAGAGPGQQAQAQLDQAKLNLSYTKIVAPEAGIITRKSVEINQNVAPGRTCSRWFRLKDLVGHGQLQGDAAAPHAAGQAVEIEVDSTGKTITAR
jgi:membrane fusion protein, multidrug efflux system